jgi:hypothetical protein
MPKTIEEIHALLTGHGYACERPLDMIVATTVTTKTYKNPSGQKELEILLTFDRANDCVAIEILHAFDLKKAAHREATLACLMTASARTPLLRPTLEPEGDIRLRIDCTCGSEGAREEDVLKALALLPCFADAWHEQITLAMEKGRFDPNKVAHINLSRARSARKCARLAAEAAKAARPMRGPQRSSVAAAAAPISASSAATSAQSAVRPSDPDIALSTMSRASCSRRP